MTNGTKQEKFLRDYNETKYDKPSVAIDILIFTIENNKLKVVLGKRNEMPYEDMFALPGVFVKMDETLEEAAYRGIEEEIGKCDVYLEQLYTWGAINRDPRLRVISVSYMALVSPDKLNLVLGDRVSEISLFSVDELFNPEMTLAFDHEKMIECAMERIKNKVEYTKIAFEFVNKEFTLPQLQNIYEILLNKTLYKANFRKKIIDIIDDTNKMTERTTHRPSKLYRLKEQSDD
jgi:8-oxo-dGTP diphosphatase